MVNQRLSLIFLDSYLSRVRSGRVPPARAGQPTPGAANGSPRRVSLTKTEKWWAMSCGECGGFVPIRIVEASERVPPGLKGRANCVRCNAPNVLDQAALFVIDGTRLRRIRLSAPSDYVK